MAKDEFLVRYPDQSRGQHFQRRLAKGMFRKRGLHRLPTLRGRGMLRTVAVAILASVSVCVACSAIVSLLIRSSAFYVP